MAEPSHREGGEGAVLADRFAHQQAGRGAVLGDVDEASLERLGRRGRAIWLAGELDPAGLDRPGAAEQPAELLDPRSLGAGDTDDAAGGDTEAEVAQVAALNPVQLQQRRRGGVPLCAGARSVGQVATGDRGDQALVVDLLAGGGEDDAAVAQDRYPVDLVELDQAVGDVEDGDPGRGQPPDGVLDDLDLVGVEAGRRLVHDDQPGVAGDRQGDRHQSLLVQGEVAHPRRRVDVELEAVEHLTGALGPRPAVDVAGVAGEAEADEDVLGDSLAAKQQHLLGEHRDPQLEGVARLRHLDLVAVPDDAASVGADRAADHLDEGRLAGAVLAEQTVELAGMDIDPNPVQGNHARVGLS